MSSTTTGTITTSPDIAGKGLPKINEIINASIKLYSENGYLDANLISDGYHTFGELYEHRITLFIAYCKILSNLFSPERISGSKNIIWRSKLHSDGSEFKGWFMLGIYKEKGEQITYHLPISEWENTNFAETLDKAPEWDGHTSEDVLTRLKNL